MRVQGFTLVSNKDSGQLNRIPETCVLKLFNNTPRRKALKFHEKKKYLTGGEEVL